MARLLSLRLMLDPRRSSSAFTKRILKPNITASVDVALSDVETSFEIIMNYRRGILSQGNQRGIVTVQPVRAENQSAVMTGYVT